MKIGIKDGKVYDICSELVNKRDNSIDDKDYLDKSYDGEISGDTWDFENGISLKDSPQRLEAPQKTPEQIEIDNLKIEINNLKNRMTILEQ